MIRNIFLLCLLVFTFFSAQSQNKNFNSIKLDSNTIERSKNKEIKITVLKHQNNLTNNTETESAKEFNSVKNNSIDTININSKSRRTVSLKLISQKEFSEKKNYKNSSLTNERKKSTNSKSHTLIAIPIKN